MSEITTAEELDALLAVAGEEAEPVVVREDFRVWTLTEDENGQWWAWSWREEGEDGKPRRAESLRLPLLVLHAPPAPTLATEAAHALTVSAADVQQALDDLDEIAPVGHTVYVSTADAPEECTDECPGCMTDRIRAVLTATLRITVTDGGEGRG